MKQVGIELKVNAPPKTLGSLLSNRKWKAAISAVKNTAKESGAADFVELPLPIAMDHVYQFVDDRDHIPVRCLVQWTMDPPAYGAWIGRVDVAWNEQVNQ